MNEMPMLLVAAAALVDIDGRVLVQQRPEGKTMAGLWEFPGGKVEPGERLEQSLVRELKEELDVDVTEACLAPFTFASHVYDDYCLLMPLFVCRVWQGTLRSGRAWPERTGRSTRQRLPDAGAELGRVRSVDRH